MGTHYDSFDDFASTERMGDYREQAPFAFREDKTEEATLEWLNTDYDNLEHMAHSRLITYRRFMALYKGIQWRYYDVRDSRRESDYLDRKPRQSVNFTHEMVEARTSQMARLKSAITAIPNNINEQSDINNAKSCKMLIDARAYDLDLQDKFTKGARTAYQMGHSFTKVYWDADCGEEIPALKKLRARGGKIPKNLERTTIGDVNVKILAPDRVFPQAEGMTWEEKDWLHEIEWMPIEEAKALWPNKKNEIKENQRALYDYSTTELTQPKTEIMVRTFWHKPTKFLPEGAKIIYTDDVILESGNFPYEHGILPFVPRTDIDIYGEFWGRSFISNIEQLQRMYNNIQSGIARDFSIGSAPKWVMPKGACDISSINNEFTIIQYTGPTPPQMVTKNPTPPQNFQFQEIIEGKISKQSNVYDISRGEVPSGVTANSALRFLDEQESQAIMIQQTKQKRYVVDTYKQMLSLMAQYYRPEDGRTARILGKGNEYLIKSMKDADFSKIYDIRLQNTSALPDTKAGKIAAMVDLNAMTQTDPIFKKEEVVEMLDLGNDDYFKDRASVSTNAARTALERLMQGEEVVEPKPWDDLLIHYGIFLQEMQSADFKQRVDRETQSRLAMYIMTLEGLMYDKATKNQKFLAQLMEEDCYPIFFKPDMPLFQLQQAMMAPPVQAGAQPVNTKEMKTIGNPEQEG